MSELESMPEPHVPKLPNATGTGAIAHLRAFTPARVGLGRTGVSLATHDLLDFQACHARARDAVHTGLESAALAATFVAISGGETLRLHSAAPDRSTYLKRPDLGRTLDSASQTLLVGRGHSGPYDLAIVVADGLSALAIERHAAPLLAELLPRLSGWLLAPVSIVEQGRVAIADPIGAALGARMAAILIGERPGLNSPDSLGVYITYEPHAGRTDAERTCISNIRPEGLAYAQAASELECILNEARHLRLTGVALKQATHQIEKAHD